jgi:hypothetical protein
VLLVVSWLVGSTKEGTNLTLDFLNVSLTQRIQ